MGYGPDIVENAAALALRAHAAQRRKDSDAPYVVHPLMVALLLARHGFPDAVIAAGIAHDILEDTAVGEEELRAAIGEEAALIVRVVTNDDTLAWKEKKSAYLAAVRAGSDAVKAVAVADKIRNAESLLAAYERLGASLWKRFNAGREDKLWFEEAMLAMLRETWDHPLVGEYEALVAKMRALR